MGHPSPIAIERIARSHADERFDQELSKRGWSKEKILDNSLHQLEINREEINQAIINISQFKKIRINFRWDTGWQYDVPEDVESKYEYTILGLLQERKALILRQIRIFEGELKIKSLQDLVDTVHSNDIRQRLEQELKNLLQAQKTVPLLESQLNDLKRTRFLPAIGIAVGLIGVFGILLIPQLIFIEWLNNHPNRDGLYLGALMFVIGIAWGIADQKRRNAAFGTLAVGALLVIIQLIGRINW